MKKYWLVSLGCLFLFAVASCGSTKPTVNDSINTSKEKIITETVHDTIFKTEKDSSSYQALLDCINGKVVVKEVTQAESGRNLNSPKVRLENNKLSIDCEARAQELFAFWKSTNVAEKEYVTIKKTITITINKLTWWQKTQIYGFRILFSILLIMAAWKYLKFSI